MRIAVYHNQPAGGARRALHGFCTQLARRHRIDVFTLTSSDTAMLRDEDYAASVTRLRFAARPPVRMGLFLNDLARLRTLDDLETVNAETAGRIDEGGYDVALVDCCRFTYAPPILRHLRTPAVYYCHHGPWRTQGVSERSARSPYETARHLVHLPFELRYEARLRGLDRALVRSADRVVTNSRHSQSRIRATTGVEAAVCPPGVSLPAPGRRGEGEHVLTVGDLVPHKGHDLVVRALATLPAGRRPPLHVIGTSGGRHYRLGLERLAAGLGVDLVVSLGVDERELEGEQARALLFAYGARREPLGLAPLEAMAHGLPVVAVGEGGVAETIADGRTGYLVPPDPARMGDRIGRLLADPAQRARIGEAARAAVEAEWTWERRGPALERLLEAAARGAPAEVAAR